MTCEKCWDDAEIAARLLGGSKVDHYHRLLEERKQNPCRPRDQAGQFWSEEEMCDSRKLGGHK